MASGGAAGCAGIGLCVQAYAPGSPCRQVDGAFAGQRLEMVFGGVGGLEAKRACDFHPGGGETGAGDFTANKVEDLLLARGKRAGHTLLSVGLYSIDSALTWTKNKQLAGSQ